MNARLNNALLLLDRVLEEVETGFVACSTCGDQEDTKSLDFVDDLKDAKAELLKLVEKPDMPATVEYANKQNKKLKPIFCSTGHLAMVEEVETECKSPNGLVMDSENMLSLIDQAVTSLDSHPIIDETFLAGKLGNKQIQVTVTQDEDEFIYSEGDHYVLPIEKKA